MGVFLKEEKFCLQTQMKVKNLYSKGPDASVEGCGEQSLYLLD